MWCTAERRFVRRVCLRHPFRPFLLWDFEASTPSQKLEVAESDSTLHQFCTKVASCSSLCCSYRKRHPSHAKKQRVWSRSCALQDLLRTMQWLCSQLCFVTAANQWTLVEIELLASVGWKWGCQPFSCPSSQFWSTAERRFTRHVCLRHPFRLFHFGIPSIQSLPEAGSWERQYAPPVLHCACIMPIPSLYLQKNEPVSCREAKRLVKQLWSPRFVTMQWLCSQLCFVTAANQRTVVEIELLATVGWKWGCQPFSCPCSQNVTHCRKETCWTCLSKESIPATPFWISKHPLPARSRFLRATVGSTSSALCLHHAHPFVSAQKQRVWSQSCGLHDFLQCSDCALSCATWLLQTNEQLSRSTFQQQWVGSVAASLSAAQICKIWCTAERRFARHVGFRNPFPPFLWEMPSIHSLSEAWGSRDWQHTLPALDYVCIKLAKDPIPLSKIPDLCFM